MNVQTNPKMHCALRLRLRFEEKEKKTHTHSRNEKDEMRLQLRRLHFVAVLLLLLVSCFFFGVAALLSHFFLYHSHASLNKIEEDKKMKARKIHHLD